MPVPDLSRIEQELASVGTGLAGVRSAIPGWPADYIPPVFAEIQALEVEGKALLSVWRAKELGDRQPRLAVAEVHQGVLRAELRDAKRRLQGFGEGRIWRMTFPPPPVVSEWFGRLLVLAAGIADFTVLQRVFQIVDPDQHYILAGVLAVVVSVIIMFGGLLVGRAFRQRQLVLASPPEALRADDADAAEAGDEDDGDVGDEDDGDVGDEVDADVGDEDVSTRAHAATQSVASGVRLATVVTVGLVALSVAVAMLRSTSVLPTPEARAVLGLEPQHVAIVTFSVLQVMALVIAIAVSYFSYRHRDFPLDSETRSWLRFTWRIRRLRRDVAVSKVQVTRLKEELKAIAAIFEASTQTLDAKAQVARARAEVAISGQLGFAAHHAERQSRTA